MSSSRPCFFVCQSTHPGFSQNSPSLPYNSVSSLSPKQYSRDSIPLVSYKEGHLKGHLKIGSRSDMSHNESTFSALSQAFQGVPICRVYRDKKTVTAFVVVLKHLPSSCEVETVFDRGRKIA